MEVEVIDTEVVVDNLLQLIEEICNLPESLLEEIAAETSYSREEVEESLRATKTLVALVPYLEFHKEEVS